MNEITLYLDKTTKAQFCNWLLAFRLKNLTKQYPYDGERDFTLYYPPDIHPDYKNQIGIMASIGRLVEVQGKGEVLAYHDLQDVIKIAWLEVGERMKLTVANYAGKWIIPPVFDLLVEICKDWQETKPDIYGYIQEQSAKYGIEFTGQSFPIDTGTAQPADIMSKVIAPRKDADGSAAITLNIIDLVLKGEGKELESNSGIIGDQYRHLKTLYDLGDGDLTEGENIFRARQEFISGSPAKDKVKHPNLQTLERATIWRHLSPFIKSLNGRPTAKDCIAKIKEYPAYKKKKISRQRMERILSEGYSNAYEDILKTLR